MSDKLSDDPRWRRLHERGQMCSNCKESHLGLFDLTCNRPDQFQSDDKRPNSELFGATHILTEDFCILEDQHYFVRCVLQLPIIGSDTAFFGYGIWSTLSKKNFDIYVSTFDEGNQGGLGPWFGWFSNCLKGYPDTLNLKCQVYPQEGRKRPYVEIEPTDNRLYIEQRDGITFERVLELYALNGHDLRQALTD
jgi:hypothetical protein